MPLTSSQVPRDCTGREIFPGYYIVYPHQIASSSHLRVARVFDISQVRDHYRENGWRLKIVFYDEGCLKRSTLQYPERTCVLSPDMVPEDLRDRLIHA